MHWSKITDPYSRQLAKNFAHYDATIATKTLWRESPTEGRFRLYRATIEAWHLMSRPANIKEGLAFTN